MSTDKLTGANLLEKIEASIEALGRNIDHGAIAIEGGYVKEDGTADLDAYKKAFDAALDEFKEEGAEEIDDTFDTVDTDAAGFAQLASAIVRKSYLNDFPQEILGPVIYPKLEEKGEEKLPYYYDRLSNTLFGWFCINIIRSVVCSWYGRLGCTDAGTPDERIERYLAVWDAWETAHGGCDKNAKPCVEVIDGSAQEGSAYYYNFLGRRIAEVLCTMTHNAQHPDDQWPLEEDFYKDYEYVHKQLIEGTDVVRNAVANSVIYLPRFSGRFTDIGEQYVGRWWENLIDGKLIKKAAETPAVPNAFKVDARYNLLMLITQDDYDQSIAGSASDEDNWERVLNQADGEIYWRYTQGECFVNSETEERMTAEEYAEIYPPLGLEYYECTFSPKWSEKMDYYELWEMCMSDGSIDEDETDVDELSKMIKAGKYLMGDKGGYILMAAS